jgi:hypothetical protein
MALPSRVRGSVLLDEMAADLSPFTRLLTFIALY